MKSIYIFCLIAFSLAFLQSCSKDFLTRDNPTATTDDKWWKNETNVRNALNLCYGGLPGGWQPDGSLGTASWTKWRMLYNVLSEETVTGWTWYQNFTLGLATPTEWMPDEFYQINYLYIRHCSRFLENYENAFVQDPERKKQYVAEARNLRAFYHYEAFLLYGEIPVVDKSITPNESSLARSSKENLVNFVTSELDAAAPDLPVSYPDPNEEFRISRAAAYAIQSDMYLNAGEYQKAAQAARKVIDLNAHELHPDYRELFTPAGMRNKERILFRRRAVYGAFARQMPLFYGCLPNTAPTLNLINVYETLQGKTIWELGEDSVDIYQRHPKFHNNRDSRLDATIVVPGDVLYLGYVPDPYAPDSPESFDKANASPTGFWAKKYTHESQAGNIWDNWSDYMIIRYAQVLLNYVEGLVESGDWQNPDVVKYLNEIRRRAKMPDVDITVYNTEEKLRELYRRERQVEFATEGLRIFDIRRWKIGETVLNGPTYGAVDPATGNPRLVLTKKFTSPRDYRWPIPQTEMNRNSNIEQNPGW
ncbi:RagB/SusD family nutrient uptake outer membrane protein [Agriterribacter sp.]|uniref:RagB/SusD family nutrient uptake outer membrane protein n=1 Tax=Agriterribacter sp. TaxID=2821509 RepID=UPI002B8FAFF1|nr:RagB/SusD family nutrient uptake outer membrane protein [Agriterribacter sp.]HRP56833.1 RagB/SusD family nutrient uptake outer membrane protein [Agriterribacter sp.]